MSASKAPFFVGYLKVPASLKPFLIVVAAVLMAAAGSLSILIGATQDDPGDARFAGNYGNQRLSGVIELLPLPILHVVEGTERVPAGRTIMLSAGGKNGAQNRPAAQDGQYVTVNGVAMERGTIDMLQIRGGNRGISASDGSAQIPVPENLGRWKLAGEICDGKCLNGAMRPGRGLAHKACANLCIIGGVPPVFVSTQPVAGSDFLMITGPEKSELPGKVYDYVAQYVSVEGEISRHGDLLVFALDPDTLEVLP